MKYSVYILLTALLISYSQVIISQPLTASYSNSSPKSLSPLPHTTNNKPHTTNYTPPTTTDSASKNQFHGILTLPVSEKQVIINEEIPQDKLLLLDRYLASGFVSKKSADNIEIQEMNDLHVDTLLELENEYVPAEGKKLGIWTNYLSPSECIKLGFNQYFVNYNPDIKALNSNISQVHESGFEYSDIMVSLGNDNIEVSKDILENCEDVGLYFIDEPVEHKVFGGNFNLISAELLPALLNKNPGAKILLSSYHAPEGNICGTAVGDKYMNLMDGNNNIFIQCDKYTMNCCGNVPYYWNEFQNYYGINKNFSNWISVTVNNGSTPGDFPCSTWPFPNSADWETLLKLAGKNGMRSIWLYAEETGNKESVLNFCFTAWKTGWLQRKTKTLVIAWKQIKGEHAETWPSGEWYVSDIYYDGPGEGINYSK